MMKNRNSFTRGAEGTRRLRLAVPLAALAALGLTACDTSGLLDVPDPDVIRPELLQGAAALPALHAHAIGEFTAGYVGRGDLAANSGEGQILVSGLLADEFIHTGTFDTREIIDRRIVPETNATLETAFRLLHRGRVAAEWASEFFAAHGANTAQHAEVQSLAGFTYVFFGENFCPGVPFSRQQPDGRFQFGDPQTTTQTFNRALTFFDGALASATTAGSAAQQNLARVGRGRALLGLGRYDDAAAAVQAVPTGFEYRLFHSATSTRQNNTVWRFNNEMGRWSVADREGVNGLPFRSDGNVEGAVRDPRVPTRQIGAAQRTALRARGEHWAQEKFPTRDANTVLANGIEARLIQAEAELRLGAAGVGAFVSIHNALRATVGLEAVSLADVTGMTQLQREDLHFRERAYWLFITSHRLGDLRRMMWDYGRQQQEIFPIGAHHRAGLPYGTETNLPIPFDEQNNPQAEGCITRSDAART
jgi:starch-binding outer membrane protein, SusD/RagB family